METPAHLASTLREEFASREESLDVFEAAASLGCQVGAPGAIGDSGRVEAELRPHRSQNRFYVKVDPTPRSGWGGMSKKARERLAHQRFRFRVCHELGHTQFFKRTAGKGPIRKQPWSAREERWCDEFARALLVPPSAVEEMAPTAASALAIQARFDVSLEVALRALVESHPGCEGALWFWPPGEPARPTSLLRQWTNLERKILRGCLQSDLIARAMAKGEGKGFLPGGNRRACRQASVVSDRNRRQVVLLAVR